MKFFQDSIFNFNINFTNNTNFNFFNYEIINIVLGAKWLDAVKIIGLLIFS